jgi:hypothetical protein
MNDEKKLSIMKIIGGLFIAGIIIFIATIFIIEIQSGTYTIWLFIIIIPAILIVLTLFLLIKRQSEGVKSGLPLDDEMSMRIKERAGYNTYLITTYFVLALMWYNIFSVEQFGVPEIPMNYLIFGILFFMFTVFSLNWIVLNRKGVES